MKNLFDEFNPIVFLLSFSLGLLIIEFYDPRKIVIQSPNPFNYKDLLYKQENGNCYKYDMKTVSCKNQKDIKQFA